MSKPVVHLHIGLHKTGTTALQTYLSQHRETLLAEQVLYPAVGCPAFARYGQHLLAWSCLEPENYLPFIDGNRVRRADLMAQNLWDGLRTEMTSSHCSTVLISSEEFSVLNRNGIDEVASHLRDYDVQVVVYLRRQDDFLESAYSTAVLYSGETRNFVNFADAQRTNLDYWALVSDWAEVFGRHNVVVRSYEDASVRRNLTQDFFRSINLDLSSLPPPSEQRVNARVSPHLTEVVRGLRLRGWSTAKLTGFRDSLSAMPLPKAFSAAVSFMPEDYRQRLMERSDSSNRRLLAEYGCDLNHRPGADKASAGQVVSDFCESLVLLIDAVQTCGGFSQA